MPRVNVFALFVPDAVRGSGRRESGAAWRRKGPIQICGFAILPDRMQRVQTRTCLVWPSIMTRTRCRFGSHRLLV